MITEDPFIKVVMTDHEMAAWLKKNGWDGEYHKNGNSVTFTNKYHVNIALCLYNNQNCTRITYVRKDYWNASKKIAEIQRKSETS